MDRERVRLGAKVAGALAAAGALVVSWVAAVIALRWARLGAAAMRFAVRMVTLRAYRRCPDCLRILRREASVCRSCGGRAASRP
jgi:rRNA maturation endonuclease Nob1